MGRAAVLAGAGAALAAALIAVRAAPWTAPRLSRWVARARGVIAAAIRRRREVRNGLNGLIGETPLVRIASLSEETGCEVLAKCELLNPGGSSKDRIARNIVEEAEAAGKLRPGGTIVEGTSGNTGISLALVARARGYKCLIVMPDDMAVEKRRLLERLGATIELVRPAASVNDAHYVSVARRRAAEIDGGFFADQFETLANARAHFKTTGPEIWRQTGGKLDAFVMSAGTGGTIAGASAFLKAQDPSLQVVLADPQGSSLYYKVNNGVLYTREQAERRIRRSRDDTLCEGIGFDRLTANFEAALPRIDRAIRVSDDQVVAMSRRILREDGLFVGSSSCVNLEAARQTALALGPGHVVVTVLCGGGAREQTKLYNDDFVRGRGIKLPLEPGAELESRVNSKAPTATSGAAPSAAASEVPPGPEGEPQPAVHRTASKQARTTPLGNRSPLL